MDVKSESYRKNLDEFLVQEGYIEKTVNKIQILFTNYKNTHSKDTKDKIQIDIISLLEDLEEEITNMKKNIASRNDFDTEEFNRREKIIQKYKDLFTEFNNKSNDQMSKRLDYDPRESILKKTEFEKKQFLEEKKKKLDDAYLLAHGETKKMKKGAREIGDYLEKDKVKTKIMHDNILEVRQKVEKAENSLEDFLKKSSLINSCSNSCLWITALIEFLVLLLLLAI